jgi:ABC-type multidrug transport system fused ATPase/permease subunit
MESLYKSAKKHELLLTVLIVLYIVLNVPTPSIIASYVDTPLGNIAVVVIALSLFMHSHAVVGVLGLFAAYVLIRRSSRSAAIESYVPSERRKSEELSAFNQFPVTLEEQMVALRAPLADTAVGSGTASFHPNQLDQTSLGYTRI